MNKLIAFLVGAGLTFVLAAVAQAGSATWDVSPASANWNSPDNWTPVTVPNGPAQQAVIRKALANAGLKPADVDYVEAHGTGTPLGDPIEINALGEVFKKSHTPARPLWIGSAKTNLGHMESAAGIGGLIKVILQLQKGMIAPHLHFQRPSTRIPWAQLPVQIPTTLVPWTSQTGKKRVAGVSSFGFSGTNAHLILESAPAAKPGTRQFERARNAFSASK